mmetsp:Transcript_9876/g.21474  ORF Transcript_9876/g.21474 Transcript_9876/m.21474 type:complete len:208 (-) Transcript_9876:367-990(-)
MARRQALGCTCCEGAPSEAFNSATGVSAANGSAKISATVRLPSTCCVGTPPSTPSRMHFTSTGWGTLHPGSASSISPAVSTVDGVALLMGSIPRFSGLVSQALTGGGAGAPKSGRAANRAMAGLSSGGGRAMLQGLARSSAARSRGRRRPDRPSRAERKPDATDVATSAVLVKACFLLSAFASILLLRRPPSELTTACEFSKAHSVM